MNKFTYRKEQIERVLNIINTLTFKGVIEASKIVEIVNILNSFEIVENAEEATKFDDGHKIDDGVVKFD